MKKIFVILVLVVGLGFILIKFNLILNLGHGIHQSQHEVYVCPMHPTYTSDRPGDCPICGMRLVKREQGNKKIVHRMAKDMKMPMEIREEKEKRTEEFKLEIDPAKQQYLGIKTTKVKLRDVQKEIKALGTVMPDETKLAHIHTKFSGYVHKVFADYEGKFIKKGEPLFTVYSPELVSTQEEYLLALEAEEKLKGSKFPEIFKSQESLLEAARRRLELWDITPEQIDNLKKTRQVTKELTIFSHVSGFITKKEVFEGTEIAPHETLYDIADLSKVWVLLEVYENDLSFIKVGQTATINFTYENLKPYTGKITYLYPTIDPMTRTAKVRIEVNNSGFKLKPDMYVSATIQSDIGKNLVVPQSAVIESGNRQIIFVKEDKGYFIPKEVKLGAEVNDERVVYSGINEQDEVVTDGNFLLDSESNLETALGQMKGHEGHSSR